MSSCLPAWPRRRIWFLSRRPDYPGPAPEPPDRHRIEDGLLDCPDRRGQGVEPAQVTDHLRMVPPVSSVDDVSGRRREPVQPALQQGGRAGAFPAAAARRPDFPVSRLRLREDCTSRRDDLGPGPPGRYLTFVGSHHHPQRNQVWLAAGLVLFYYPADGHVHQAGPFTLISGFKFMSGDSGWLETKVLTWAARAAVMVGRLGELQRGKDYTIVPAVSASGRTAGIARSPVPGPECRHRACNPTASHRAPRPATFGRWTISASWRNSVPNAESGGPAGALSTRGIAREERPAPSTGMTR